MKTKQEIQELINQAHGTEQYHKYSPIPGYPIITDGVLAVAEAAECFWFLDIIGSYQGDKRLDPYFQVWKLTVNDETGGAVVCGYNDTELIIKQKIEFTDFPLDELKVFVIQGVILLPGEY